jgi:hypothetical protein
MITIKTWKELNGCWHAIPLHKDYPNMYGVGLSAKIAVNQEELQKEIKQAFIHGQGNKEMMEAGLERDETEDYVRSRMRSLLNQNKDEYNIRNNN